MTPLDKRALLQHAEAFCLPRGMSVERHLRRYEQIRAEFEHKCGPSWRLLQAVQQIAENAKEIPPEERIVEPLDLANIVPYEPRERPFLERCMLDKEPTTQPLIYHYRSILADQAKLPIAAWGLPGDPTALSRLAECYRDGLRLVNAGKEQEPRWREMWLGIERDFDGLAAMSLRAASIPGIRFAHVDGIIDPRADAKRELFWELLSQKLFPIRRSIARKLWDYGFHTMESRGDIKRHPNRPRRSLRDTTQYVDIELLKLLLGWRATSEYPFSPLGWVKLRLKSKAFCASFRERARDIPYYDVPGWRITSKGGGFLVEANVPLVAQMWPQTMCDGGDIPDLATISWDKRRGRRKQNFKNLTELNATNKLISRVLIDHMLSRVTPAQRKLLEAIQDRGGDTSGLNTADRMKLSRIRKKHPIFRDSRYK